MKKEKTMPTRAQVQKQLDAKITPAIWDKETDRFAEMTTKALRSRIMRITNVVKMEAFRQVAKQQGLKKLQRLAREKRDFFIGIA